jgi:hypothetical protein
MFGLLKKSQVPRIEIMWISLSVGKAADHRSEGQRRDENETAERPPSKSRRPFGILSPQRNGNVVHPRMASRLGILDYAEFVA